MPANNDPLVTVGIPTFNRPAGLRRTLEALCSQKYGNLEILVSDNCSTNPEVDPVLKEFSESDPRIVIHKHGENIGAVFNFFSLVEKATGKYFMWAADDDWWDPDFVRVSVGLLEESPDAAVSVTKFQPLPQPSGKPRMIPPAFRKIRKIKEPSLCRRLEKYISQKETFGKAHITYGMFPLPVIRDSIAVLLQIIGDADKVRDFSKVDVFLNAIILSKGDLATSDSCLRKFEYGPRTGGNSGTKLKWGVDPDLMAYFGFLSPLVDRLPVSEAEKKSLHAAVSRRQASYLRERILRKILIYRIYWSVYKRLFYEKW